MRNLPHAEPLFAEAANASLGRKNALQALQIVCTYEGIMVPNSVEDALLEVRMWMLKVSRLEAAVSELSEHERIREAEEEAYRRYDLHKIQATQK